MNKINLKAQERTLLGKKVKQLRHDGVIPAHVYGNKIEGESVSIKAKDLIPVIKEAGETGVIDLRIGEEKVRPVMVKGMQYDPLKGDLLHVDFYQVNLKEKVAVPVPLVFIGDEPELVHTGEAIVLQQLTEVQVEALPTDLVDTIEVNIQPLQNIDDVITVGQLSYNHDTLTILTDPEEVVVKLAPAVTQEMEEIMEEQASESTEGEAETEPETGAEGQTAEQSKEEGSGESDHSSTESEESSH